MIKAQQLSESFALNLRIIQLQTEGLSHEDSLAQLPYNINSMNWVIGHIAVNRDNLLRLLNEEPLMNEAQTARYQRGSDPVKKADEIVLRLDELLDILLRGQNKITAGLMSVTNEDLAVKSGESGEALSSRLFALYFHDTYHTGQTELLRQVAGKNDQVIR